MKQIQASAHPKIKTIVKDMTRDKEPPTATFRDYSSGLRHASCRQLEPAARLFSSPSLIFSNQKSFSIDKNITMHKNQEDPFLRYTYKGSIIHKGQSGQNNKCNLKYIVPVI